MVPPICTSALQRNIPSKYLWHVKLSKVSAALPVYPQRQLPKARTEGARDLPKPLRIKGQRAGTKIDGIEEIEKLRAEFDFARSVIFVRLRMPASIWKKLGEFIALRGKLPN